MRGKQAALPVDPDVGAYVLYRDAARGSAGHTGRFISRKGKTWRLRTLAGVKRVEARDVEGYWPAGIRKRDPERLVRVRGYE